MVHSRYRLAEILFILTAVLASVILALAFLLDAREYVENYNTTISMSIGVGLIFFASLISNMWLLVGGRVKLARLSQLFSIAVLAVWAIMTCAATYLIRFHIDYKFLASLLTVIGGLLVAGLHALMQRVSLSRAANGGQLMLVEKVIGGGAPRTRHLSKIGSSPYILGVHKACGRDSFVETAPMPPYVERECDISLRWALACFRTVIIVEGNPLSGKTRTAFEAVLATRQDSWFAAPKDPQALKTILDRPLPLPRKTVLWLDEIERFLDVLDLPSTVGKLELLGVTIIGTSKSDSHKPIDTATYFDVTRALTVSEIARARQLNNYRIDAALGDDELGFAASLAGAKYVLAEYLDAERSDTHRTGRSILRAAADCKRAGYPHLLHRDELYHLHKSYLRASPGGEEFDFALAWACGQITPASPMPLLIEGRWGYGVLSYFVEHFDHPDGPSIPGEIWAHLLGNADDSSLVMVGLSAFEREEFGIAGQAFYLAASRGSVLGMFNLAAVHHLGKIQQDATGLHTAEKWYRQALGLGDLPSGYVLYRLLRSQWRFREARTVTKQVPLHLRVTKERRRKLGKAAMVAGSGGALAYLISPIDAVPDVIPVIGFADDVVGVPITGALSALLTLFFGGMWLVKTAPISVMRDSYLQSRARRIDVEEANDVTVGWKARLSRRW